MALERVEGDSRTTRDGRVAIHTRPGTAARPGCWLQEGLATLGELVTGLAALTALSPGERGILTALEVECEKKARAQALGREPDLLHDRRGDDAAHGACDEKK